MKPKDADSTSIVISNETAEMIEHIFSASQTAIEVLNDLLQYEHIDSGNELPQMNSKIIACCCNAWENVKLNSSLL